MQQQRSNEQREMVVYDEQNEETPKPEPEPEPSSSEPPPPSRLNRNIIIEEIMMKYGLERQNHPPIVIAKPIPSSSGPTSAIPSEPTSAPPPSAVKFSESRKKAVARKHANKSSTSTESAESEQEIPSVQAEQEIPSVQAITILKEVKLEIEDMTPEEFEKYGYTDKISFGQMV